MPALRKEKSEGLEGKPQKRKGEANEALALLTQVGLLQVWPSYLRRLSLRRWRTLQAGRDGKISRDRL